MTDWLVIEAVLLRSDAEAAQRAQEASAPTASEEHEARMARLRGGR